MEAKTIGEALAEHKISRREFLKFCTIMAGTLALPASYAPKIAEALEKAKKPVVIWLEYQDCAGCSESFLRARNPTVAEIVLDVLAVEYHETIMAAAGKQAEEALHNAIQEKGYLVVVEGSIPVAEGGVYCCVGGRSAVDILKEVANGAAAVIAVGNCASFGGLAAAAPNPTGAKGVSDIVTNVPVVNLPGCPMNVDNLVATIVHYLTFGGLPATDGLGRPLFAYGKRIHDHCERRAHFDAGQFVEKWGDEGHRLGWCLYKMGCKGPETYHNCPDQRWNEGISWPVWSGHGCIGCSEPHFWDTMSPFYRRLPQVPGFGIETTADKIGLTLTGITAAGIAAHAIGSAIRAKITKGPEKPEGSTEE
ncbi:MAG: [Ni/Fe] hydrogenase small subunit [Chloroflexi bacterium]|nr:MAG: [Ni/Fe] hydrogenase small subunit [Chloroflexota bacterium]HDN78864.1 twin-arginine translocation signal domain-containing protein [Chloroflexota bacterium]